MDRIVGDGGLLVALGRRGEGGLGLLLVPRLEPQGPGSLGLRLDVVGRGLVGFREVGLRDL